MRSNAGGSPLVNVYTTADAWVLEARVPGYGRDDIELDAEGEILSLKGRPTEKGEGADASLAFERRFRIPFRFDPAAVSASLADGFLEVRIERVEEDQKKTITIQA